ncbi:MAG TPA: UbiA family prenyltransferase [Caulobacteraceae bacterium]|nr:UbiA family prenyltransferase [Caulobacteraceae bacterium]
MTTPASTFRPRALAPRLWTYQAERFPLVKHGGLILVFSGGEAVFGALVRGVAIDWAAVATAAIVCLTLFAQLRISDEHKDRWEDARWRPERPVPRGLVSLGELRAVAGAGALVQLAATLALDPRLLPVLAVVWGWMALMSVEFFAPRWLKARPVIYLVTHMAVMPLIALYAVACGARATVLLSPSVGAFLAMAFLNGVVLEIARKSWALEDERPGVDTYSRLWGPRGAALAVAIAATGASMLAMTVQSSLGTARAFHLVVAAGAAVLIAAAVDYARRPRTASASRLESASGLFVLAIYLGVAWAPAVWRAWS